MNEDIQIPLYLPPTMHADYAKWAEKQNQNAAKKAGAQAVSNSFDKIKQEFVDALATSVDPLAPKAVVPYEKTPEGERFVRFKNTCPVAFLVEVDFTKIRNHASYDRVIQWDGSFPGCTLTGATGIGKTFAAWQALRELYVKKGIPFKWFTVRDLVAEMARYESNECISDFFRMIDFFRIIFVDDLDKINWDFESHAQMLFAFLDWVYRRQKPCIVTTNRDRVWWKAKCGDAFVRRLFDDGFVEVNFK